MAKKIYTVVSLVAIALILALPFFVQPYTVSGGSMYPTLHDRDLLLIEKFSTGFLKSLNRGEILVLHNPHDKEEVDVKRVIALPGETVHVKKDKVIIGRNCDPDGSPAQLQRVEVLLVDGPCQITFASTTIIGGGAEGGNGTEFDMYLGPEDYFVLGDNRRTSADSREFGAVQRIDMIGRAVFRLYPFRSAGFFDRGI